MIEVRTGVFIRQETIITASGRLYYFGFIPLLIKNIQELVYFHTLTAIFKIKHPVHTNLPHTHWNQDAPGSFRVCLDCLGLWGISLPDLPLTDPVFECLSVLGVFPVSPRIDVSSGPLLSFGLDSFLPGPVSLKIKELQD